MIHAFFNADLVHYRFSWLILTSNCSLAGGVSRSMLIESYDWQLIALSILQYANRVSCIWFIHTQWALTISLFKSPLSFILMGTAWRWFQIIKLSLVCFSRISRVLLAGVPIMSSNQASSGNSWTPGDFEHPNEALQRAVRVSLAFAFSMPTIAVALRIWARKLTGSKLFLDDYLIMIALVWIHFLCDVVELSTDWSGIVVAFQIWLFHWGDDT